MDSLTKCQHIQMSFSNACVRAVLSNDTDSEEDDDEDEDEEGKGEEPMDAGEAGMGRSATSSLAGLSSFCSSLSSSVLSLATSHAPVAFHFLAPSRATEATSPHLRLSPRCLRLLESGQSASTAIITAHSLATGHRKPKGGPRKGGGEHEDVVGAVILRAESDVSVQCRHLEVAEGLGREERRALAGLLMRVAEQLCLKHSYR